MINHEQCQNWQYGAIDDTLEELIVDLLRVQKINDVAKIHSILGQANSLEISSEQCKDVLNDVQNKQDNH